MHDSQKQDNPVVNVASYLKHHAETRPYRKAVIYPAGRDDYGRVTYSHFTFLQLDKESDRLAHGLKKLGVIRGTRTILMVKPSLEFFALIFALFKTGAVPVVVDPGMGVRRMVTCLRSTRPEAFIGIPLAHIVRSLFPSFFKTVNVWITVGRRWFWGGYTLEKIRQSPWKPFTRTETKRDDLAAILFTTGSTGPAKGAVYTHGNFDAQLQQIQQHLGFTGDEIDLSTFPLFALFWPALGITAVIPDMDPTKPARVNPDRIFEAVINQGASSMFASPALMNRIAEYGNARHVKLPSLKRVISAGAPVSPAILEAFSNILSDDAEIQTPYGATEAVPIISITAKEIAKDTRQLSEMGYGTCIGYPINDIEIKIIKITDAPIQNWNENLVVQQGDIGEITVKGNLVSRQYFENPETDALAKIRDGNEIWHRMGDLGWQDKKGRFWFCGRKNHRVNTGKITLFSVPCEAIFNNHPHVFRSALVGVGPKDRQKPVICIELQKPNNHKSHNEIQAELMELAAKNELTKHIETILFHRSFPVDIRHNAKIFREKLAIWAGKKLKHRLNNDSGGVKRQ